jgi:hypothetical protein
MPSDEHSQLHGVANTRDAEARLWRGGTSLVEVAYARVP